MSLIKYMVNKNINQNAIIKKGCGHLGDLNHEKHTCDPECVWKDEPITHQECKNCSIFLNRPVKRCYHEV